MTMDAEMTDHIDSIYRELKKQITPARLKEISVDVIARYRADDRDGLSYYADLLGLDHAGLSTGRLFAHVIQCYHPDKLTAIIKDLEMQYREKKAEELIRIRNTFIFEIPSRRITFTGAPAADETYSYTGEDFGYDERAAYDEDIPAGDEHEDRDEFSEAGDYGFIEAVNRLFFGNLDAAITMDDLHELEGELDLSDYDIVDLKGIEHCINIHTLNLSGNDLRRIEPLASLTRLEALFLSGNSIRNISCLAPLAALRELDLSFNEIEDISVLKELEALQYVNLLGNPIHDTGTIRQLSDRGVLVICD